MTPLESAVVGASVHKTGPAADSRICVRCGGGPDPRVTSALRVME